MRLVLVAASLGLCVVGSAWAGGGTTSTVPSTTTSTSSSTSSSSVTTTSVTTTTVACSGDCDADAVDKPDCKGCCGTCFQQDALACNTGSCNSSAWGAFVDAYRTANQDYEACQDDEDAATRAADFTRYNVNDSCFKYQIGCNNYARKIGNIDGFPCAGIQECVACCSTVLVRKQRQLARNLVRGNAGCRQALKCFRKQVRRRVGCEARCRQRPTCGAESFRDCLEGLQRGRPLLACFGKCADKCGNRDSYKWCLQACSGADECDAFDKCSDRLDNDSPRGCLASASSCVPITTTTSTSSTTSTSTTSSTTTSTRPF
jgi:hypothetical protein